MWPAPIPCWTAASRCVRSCWNFYGRTIPPRRRSKRRSHGWIISRGDCNERLPVPARKGPELATYAARNRRGQAAAAGRPATGTRPGARRTGSRERAGRIGRAGLGLSRRRRTRGTLRLPPPRLRETAGDRGPPRRMRKSHRGTTPRDAGSAAPMPASGEVARAASCRLAGGRRSRPGSDGYRELPRAVDAGAVRVAPFLIMECMTPETVAETSFPPVPLTVEGASVLHQMMRFRRPAWRTLGEPERADILAEAASVLGKL